MMLRKVACLLVFFVGCDSCTDIWRTVDRKEQENSDIVLLPSAKSAGTIVLEANVKHLEYSPSESEASFSWNIVSADYNGGAQSLLIPTTLLCPTALQNKAFKTWEDITTPVTSEYGVKDAQQFYSQLISVASVFRPNTPITIVDARGEYTPGKISSIVRCQPIKCGWVTSIAQIQFEFAAGRYGTDGLTYVAQESDVPFLILNTEFAKAYPNAITISPQPLIAVQQFLDDVRTEDGPWGNWKIDFLSESIVLQSQSNMVRAIRLGESDFRSKWINLKYKAVPIVALADNSSDSALLIFWLGFDGSAPAGTLTKFSKNGEYVIVKTLSYAIGTQDMCY